MRNAKEGKVRKNEILDIALSLFYEKGYGNTTVEDILNKAGISKGAFYYYFETKEDVLKVLALRETEKKLELTRISAVEEGLSAIEKLNKIIAEAQKINFGDIENRMKVFRAVNEYGNIEFMQRLHDNSILSGTPLIQRILEQGIDEKTMAIEYPQEAAEFYIKALNNYKADIGKLWFENDDKSKIKSLLIRKTCFYQDLLEKTLGIEKGKLHFLIIAMHYIEKG